MGVEEARREFARTLRIAAGLVLAVGGALCAWRVPVGGGFLVGGAAGVLAYVWIARLLPKLETIAVEEMGLYSARQALARMAMYAVAFTLAYRLDRVGKTGMLGALAGLLLVRAVLTVSAWRNARAMVKESSTGDHGSRG